MKRKVVVYPIFCTECAKVCIGQTGISLKHQLKRHWHTLRNGEVAASALAEHAITAGHGIDLSKAEVLDSNQYTVTQCMLESWHIQQNRHVHMSTLRPLLHGIFNLDWIQIKSRLAHLHVRGNLDWTSGLTWEEDGGMQLRMDRWQKLLHFGHLERRCYSMWIKWML